MGRKKKYFTEEERKAAHKAHMAKWYQKHKTEMAEYNAERYQQKRDDILAQNTEWRKNNPEYMSEWIKNNPEYMTEWRKEHKDEIRAQRAEYYSTPYGRANCLLRNYRKKDKKYNRGECALTADWIVENVFSGQVCHYCGETDWMKLGVDRIDNSLPHIPDNVVPCCGACNKKRGTTPYDIYMRLIGKIN